MTPPDEPRVEAPGARRAARIAFSTMAAELLDHYPAARWVHARSDGDTLHILSVTDEAGAEVPGAADSFTALYASTGTPEGPLIRAEHVLEGEPEARLDLRAVAAWNTLPGA